jgi:hypothetical protein
MDHPGYTDGCQRAVAAVYDRRILESRLSALIERRYR